LSARNSSSYGRDSYNRGTRPLTPAIEVTTSALADTLKLSGAVGAGASPPTAVAHVAGVDLVPTTESVRCRSTVASPVCPTSNSLCPSTSRSLRHTLSSTHGSMRRAKHSLGGMNAVVAESSVMMDVLQASVRLKM